MIMAETPKVSPDRSTQYMRILITIALLAIYGGVIYTLMYRDVKLSDQVGNLLLVLVGILTREISTVVSFNFSSTAGSQAKDETQRAQAEAIASMTTPASTTTTVSTAAPPRSFDAAAAEAVAWEDAQTINTPASFEAYLAKYPTGINAVQARARLAAKGSV
jgi:hypothetical protein